MRHATDLVEQAARNGVVLVVLPELAASGYSLSRAVWDGADSREGRTMVWLRETAKRLGIYLGRRRGQQPGWRRAQQLR